MDFSSIFSMANPLSGGLLGVVGSVATSLFNFLRQRQDAKTQVEMKKLDNIRIDKEKDREIAIIQAEADANVKIVETQVKGTVELEEIKAFTESQKGAHATVVTEGMIQRLSEIKNKDGATPIYTQILLTSLVSLLGLLDVIKGVMRPIITTYYIVLTSYITTVAWEIVQKNEKIITADDAWAVVAQIINTVLFLTTTCVTWWFADRQTAKFLMDKYK